jgi:hypothetical protein
LRRRRPPGSAARPTTGNAAPATPRPRLERLRGELERRCSCDGDPIECSHEAARGQAEAERDALKAAIEAGEVARFAADVRRLVGDYSDRERDVIALMPFLATLDQLCLEKYGFDLDEVAALDAPSGAHSPASGRTGANGHTGATQEATDAQEASQPQDTA